MNKSKSIYLRRVEEVFISQDFDVGIDDTRPSVHNDGRLSHVQERFRIVFAADLIPFEILIRGHESVELYRSAKKGGIGIV